MNSNRDRKEKGNRENEKEKREKEKYKVLKGIMVILHSKTLISRRKIIYRKTYLKFKPSPSIIKLSILPSEPIKV